MRIFICRRITLTNVYASAVRLQVFYVREAGERFRYAARLSASEPDKLDPALNSTVDGAIPCDQRFCGPDDLRRGASRSNDPENIEMTEDGLTYTVTLKDDLKWSNGRPAQRERFRLFLEPRGKPADGFRLRLYVCADQGLYRDDRDGRGRQLCQSPTQNSMSRLPRTAKPDDQPRISLRIFL